MPGGEFDIIQRWFAGLGRADQVLMGVGDDAAVLALPAGHVLHTSTDTLVEGRHFPLDTLPEDIAYRAVATAASDLAAMGAEPLGMTLALTLPEADELWLHGFSQGLFRAVRDLGLPLIGGDTTRGPLTISVTVMGSTPAGEWMSRGGAVPGDRLCVSGTLGDGAMALAILEGRVPVDEQPDIDTTEQLLRRFTRPTARLTLGASLRSVATAAIDVSDGLLADARHLAAASGVALEVNGDQLPLSAALTAYPDRRQAQAWALAGGDDYELLFTLPPGQSLPDGCVEIGAVSEGEGVHCDVNLTEVGYDHFR